MDHTKDFTQELREPPTLDVQDVMKILKFNNFQSIHMLARRGPEDGGLTPYIEIKEAPGVTIWQRKPGSGYSGRKIKFYRAEVEAWDAQHPRQGSRIPSDISYSDEQKRQILETIEAEGLKKADGSVNRTTLFEALQKRYGISQASGWNTRKYPVIRQVLKDNGVPLSKGAARPTERRYSKGNKTTA